jgi:two-component system OmpR family sensor kinase
VAARIVLWHNGLLQRGEPDLHSDRLTRQELTWLLTQEARSAAEKLRKGVAILAAPEIRGLTSPPAPSIEPELDALDDAMKMLASLHTGGATRSRRGRIDLAALLWEVAPSARVSIEPGSGTEVFGEEAELRRMLQVLVSSTSPTGGSSEMGTPELSIRREGSEIRVSLTLGPDASATAETERAWLSRMATRYGGRFELEGATESILLPADGASEQREVESLRRELEAAQKQGEAYARELAAVFSYSQPAPPRFSSKPAEINLTLSALTAMASGMSAQLRSVFSILERELSALREGKSAAASEPLSQQMALGSEIVTDLVRLAQCPVYESMQHVNLADSVRAAMAELDSRAGRRGVILKSRIPPHVDIEARPATTTLLARLLINDGILATPRGREVTVTVEALEKGARLVVEDGGPAIPEDAFFSVVSTQMDPATIGRPTSVALFCAHTIANHLDAQVEPASASDEAPPSGSGGRIAVKFGAT